MKVKISLDDPETRSVWDAAKRAKAEVDAMPAWKRGEPQRPAKERPILFSAPMVRALLAGTKTQTRRVMRIPAASVEAMSGIRSSRGLEWHGGESGHGGLVMDVCEGVMSIPLHCPYGAAGDLLWVRETWSHDAPSLDACRAAYEDVSGGIGYGPYYRATEVAPGTLKWRPSIFMPRWASRLSLVVTHVRAQRLHDLSEDDAKAEGVPRDTCPCDHTRQSCADIGCLGPTHRASYAELWDKINGGELESWRANPWVWAISFRPSKSAGTGTR